MSEPTEQKKIAKWWPVKRGDWTFDPTRKVLWDQFVYELDIYVDSLGYEQIEPKGFREIDEPWNDRVKVFMEVVCEPKQETDDERLKKQILDDPEKALDFLYSAYDLSRSVEKYGDWNTDWYKAGCTLKNSLGEWMYPDADL